MPTILRNVLYLSSVFLTSSLLALPEGELVVVGQAEFNSSEHNSLRITTSDKAIINYQKFNIAENEHVEFIQPSSKSSVLNRVNGEDPSQILGKLSGNGKVFLVNPSGIYFGPKAVVNTGSFLASTLNIRDEDFLNDKFHFFQEEGSERVAIVNEGLISASPEGFVALFAPFIENTGSIIARAGRVVIAAAEKVALDFSGDGLIQFTVDGELEKALIENSGKIEALNGHVEISLRTARDAIKMVVNTDGIQPVNAIEESNGVIRLVSKSRIAADKVLIEGGEGSKVEVEGIVDAASVINKGGTVHILGDQVQLIGTQIDVSGENGGGTVLIGGDYQGKGIVRNAKTTFVDESSVICSDAYGYGDGGKVIIWADDTTLFDGKIIARGGENGGDGGFVETSGKINLGVDLGHVDTSALKGNYGNWLLDPASITIATGGANNSIANGSAPNCATAGSLNIRTSTLQGAATNVALCAQNGAASTITVNNSFTMAAGISISMTAGSGGAGTITLNAGISTRGQPISLTGLVTLGAAITLDTTNGGANPAGSTISLSNTVNGAQSLILNGGTGGTVTMTGAVGGGTALTSLSATGATVTQSSTARTTGAITYTGSTAISVNGNMTTAGGIVTMTGPVTVGANPTIDTTNGGGTAAGANINFSNTVNGATALTLRAGTAGVVTFSNTVGNSAPLTNLAFTSANLIQVANNITVTGANPLAFPSPVSLTGPSTILSNNANVTFNSTLNGAQALTITGGSGTTTFTGVVGGTTPLSTLTASAATVTQSSTVRTTGALNYTGSTLINLGGNVTTSGGAIGMTGPVALNAAVTVDSTNSGGTPAGGNITFSSTINNGQILVLNGGTGGAVSFGAVGGTIALTSLTVTGATISQNSTVQTTGTVNYTGSLSLGGNITTSGSLFSLTGAASLGTNVSIDTTNGGGAPSGASISFSSTVTGNQNLTLRAGVGNILFSGAVGSPTPLNTLTVTSAANVTTAAVSAAVLTQSSGIGVTTFNGLVNLSGASGLSLTTNNVTFNGNLQTAIGGPATISVGGTLSIASGVSFALDGAFTQSGVGGVQSSGSITTTNDTIQFAGPLVLTGDSVLSTGAGIGNILFSNTVDGPGNLTLTAGTGNITFVGDVGIVIRLGALQINSVNNLSVASISAVSILKVAGSGTTSFSGAMNTSGAAGIDLTGTSFALNGSINTTGGGSFTINNSGAITGTALSSTLIDGAFSQTGLGSVSVSGNLKTNNGNISFSGPITLDGATTLDSGTGNGSIAIANTIDGGNTLSLVSGTGSITFDQAVGGGTSLSDISITLANDITFSSSVNASSITQLLGTGTTTFSGSVATTGSLGLNLTGAVFNFNGAVTTTTMTTGASVNIQNSGLATLSAGTAWSLAGAFAQTGAGTTALARSITAADTISFIGPVTVSGTPTLSTAAASKDITFQSAVNGGGDLTLASGSRDILFQAAVGGSTRLGAIAISSARNVTTQALTAASIVQSAGTGTTFFNGDLDTNAIPGIQITNAAVTFGENATTTGNGVIAIVNSGLFTITTGKTLSSAGAFSQSGGGTISLAGDVTTANADLSFANPITLADSAALSTGSGAGSITLSSPINGAQPLTLTAGTGNITVSAAIGGTTRIGDFLINSAQNINIQNVSANTITVASVTGTMTTVGDFNTNAVGGIQLTGNNFSRTGALVTTNGGPLVVNNSGLITGALTNTTSIQGGYFQIGSGNVNLQGSITTVNTPISFAGPVTLVNTTSLNTDVGAGSITFSNTLQGTQAITLAAGTGDISFSMPVGGGGSPIGAITMSSVNNVTAASTIEASSISAPSIIGLVTLNGAVSTSGALGISLSAFEYAINANITTTGTGPLSLGLTGSAAITIANGVLFSLDGAFSQTGTGSVSIGGSITTTNDAISFASPVNLTGNSSLNTGLGAGNITFSSVVNGAQTLTLAAGTGSLILNGAFGLLTPLSGLTISSGTNITAAAVIHVAGPFVSSISGTATFNGSVTTTTISGMNLSANAFAINSGLTTTNGGPIAITNTGTLTISSPILSSGSFNQTGGGSVSLGANITTTGLLQIADPVTLTFSSIMTTNNGNLILSSALDGTFDLRLIAGSGNITLGGNLGGGMNPLADFVIQSANNVTTEAITAGRIEQLAGSGLTHFQGVLTTSLIDGISLVGSQFQLDQSVTTNGNGPLSIVHTGSLSIPATATPLTVDGAFTESGGGAVSIGADITTTDNNISFSDPLTLTANVAMSTGAGVLGNITFATTIGGDYCLTLTAGDEVQFNGAVSIHCLDATAPIIVQNNSITTVTTVAETGEIQLGGDITTTNSNITLTGNVTRSNTNNVTISTTGGDLHVTGTIDADGIDRNLIINAGTGIVTIDSGIGTLVPLSNLSISGSMITWSDLGTAGLPGSFGTTALTATGAIQFNGTNYNNGIQNYTAGTTFNFDAGALTTITSIGEGITFLTGIIELAPLTDLTINSSGGNVTLTELHGPGLNLNIDAITGTATVATIGQPAAGRLQSVTITASTIIDPDPIYSITPPVLQSPTITLITTNQIGPITYGSPVVIGADNLVFSGGGFIFNSTVNSDGGTRNLTINPGAGNSVTFTGPIGNIIPMTSLTIGTAQDVTINNTAAVGSFTQTGGTGTTAISGVFNTTAAGGIQITTNILSIQGIVTTSNGGALVLNNSGTLTASTAAFSIDGPFQQTGAGGVSIGGNITTTDDLISFNGAVSLANALSLNTVSATGAPVTFSSTVSGGENLSITAGVGAVTFTGAVGATRLGDLEINSAGSVTAANISAASIFQGSGSGSYTGTLNTNTVNGIQLTGGSFTFSEGVTTSSTGPFSIVNTGLLTLTPGKTYSISGAFTQSGSGLNSIGGSLVVGGPISFASAISLGGATTLNTSANGANITISSTVNGANDLSFNLGTLGDLIIDDAVGGSTRLGAFTITNGKTITTSSIRASSITQTNAQFSSSFGSLSATGAISLTGALISVNGDLISSGGSIAIINSSTLTIAAGSNSIIAGTFAQSGGGSVILSGTLQTVNNDLSFTNEVTLNGATSLSTGSGIGNITFSGTLDGNQTLNLTAGTGNIVFTGAVGSIDPIGALTITSGEDITYPAFSGLSISETSTGTTIIGGNMTSIGVSGISISADTVNQSGSITTINSGPVVIDVTNSFTKGANIISNGSFSQTGVGSVSLTGSIATANELISFAGPVTLSGSTSLTTGGAGPGNITFSSSVTETQNLSLTAGTGTITFGAAVGGVGSARLGTLTIVTAQNVLAQTITAIALSQLAGSGTTTVTGAINTNGASGINLIGTSFALQGSVTTTGGGAMILENSGSSNLSGSPFSIGGAFSQITTGAVTLSTAITAGGAISFSGPITLVGTPSLNTAAVNQPISIVNTVEGNGALTLASGSGAITFFEDVGSATRMGALAITSTGTFLGKSIRASSILQTAGAITYNGNLDTTGSINLTGTTIHLFEDLIASSGSIALTNSGTLTTEAGKTISSGGTFSQSGGGTISLGSNIITSNQNLSFASAINLTSSVALSSGAGAGSITLSDTVNGNHTLTLTAGTGDITFGSNIGGITRIGAFVINSSNDIMTKSITAASIQILGSSGTVTLIGNYDTNTIAGIQKTVTNVFRNGNITTTNGGSLIVTNSGILTGTVTNMTSISGSYIQNGTGIVDLAGTITTINNPISFSSPIILIDNATLDSGSANITLSGVVDGAKNLTLAAGAGNIILASEIGGSIPLGTFQVSGCTDLSSQAISADSITLSNVVGTATMIGDLVTSGASGIALSGNSFALSGAVTCGGAGGLTLTNSNTSSFSSTKIISLGGPFLQNGTAPVYMGGAVITNNQPITFEFDLNLIGDLILNSGSGLGNITTGPELDGNYALTVLAGTGDFICNSIVGDHAALTNFTASGNDIILVSIGTSLAPGVTGTLNLTALDFIAYNGFFYNANTQIYTAGADLDCQTGTRVTLISSGPITCIGGIHLNSGTDLYVETNGGAFSYERLRGTNFENFVVNTSGGTTILGPIGASLEINNVDITAGQIILSGVIDALNVTMISNGSILNSGAPLDIESQNRATFNALGGDVGTLSSPILVHTNEQIFAGSTYLADFNGSSFDNTVHEIISNPPCIIIFNGITIQDCGRRSPSAVPSGSTFPFPFAVPGFDSSYFNLGSNYYFLTYFFDETYVKRDVAMYYRTGSNLAQEIPEAIIEENLQEVPIEAVSEVSEPLLEAI